MARIRTIKPEFFLHEELADLTPLHRLFFVGLWTLADKDGLLEDRPKRIKAALLPWDDCDVSQLITDLEGAGCVVRYEAGDQACLFLPGFKKHQRPHPKELGNGLPPPGPDVFAKEVSRKKTRLAVFRFSSIPSGTPGKGRSLGKELLDNGKEISGKPPASGGALLFESAPQEPDGPDVMRRLWNETVASGPLPSCQELTPERRKKLATALEKRPIAVWREVFLRAAASPFLCGKNDSGFRASLSWILKSDNAAKTLEGNYDAPGGFIETGPPCDTPGCGGTPEPDPTCGRSICRSCVSRWFGWHVATAGETNLDPSEWAPWLATREGQVAA